MAPFVFTLEPLLKARRRVEEDAQRQVAAIERHRLVLEDELRRRQLDIAQGKLALKGDLVGRLDLRSLRRWAGASLDGVRKAQAIVLKLAGIHNQLETARTKLVEATKRRRAIELLRDRRHEAWKTAEAKAETAVLDELAARIAYQETDR